MQITELQNPDAVKMAPIREKMDIMIPDIIDQNIPNRNGFIYILTGSGGSGKSSLMLNMFKSKSQYRGKFDHIFYICPMSSFLSVQNHPFEKHERVYHELTVELLEMIFQHCNAIKVRAEERAKKRKRKELEKKKGVKAIQFEEVVEESSDEDNEPDVQYSAIVIVDHADSLKNIDIQKQLSKMMIKARHSSLSFFITLQSYLYFPKILRKQLTNATIFKVKNKEEYESITKEILKMSKENGIILENYVFDKPYTHLDIDLVNTEYYKNFNKLIIKEA